MTVKKNSRSCKIYISGGDPLNTGKSEAAINKEALIHLNIDPKDILLEDKSLNTFQNAEYTSSLLKKENYDQIYLVSAGTHLKRALLYFSHFGIYPKPAAADLFSFAVSFIPNGINFAITDVIIHEYLGILRYYIYEFFGWNIKAEGAFAR